MKIEGSHLEGFPNIDQWEAIVYSLVNKEYNMKRLTENKAFEKKIKMRHDSNLHIAGPSTGAG